MIEKRLTLRIPPGIVYDGTYRERAGRWIDGEFVRFTSQGEAVPISGFTALTLTGTPPSGGEARGAYSWFIADDTQSAYRNQNIVVGKTTKIYRFNSDSKTVLDITPAGFSSGGTYATWAFANEGDFLLFSKAYGSENTSFSSSPLYQWNPVLGGIGTVVTNSPGTIRGVTVTPESFVMVLYSDRTVRWASQGERTVWTPSGTNSAGDIDVPTAGHLIRLITVRGETLALGDTDAWVIDYVGGDLYYGSRKVGDNCGLHGPNAVVVMGNTAYWMGHRGFYKYDGFVQPLECPIIETIFRNWNDGASGRIFGIAVPLHNEIWWFYQDNGTSVPSKCIRYNPSTGMWYKENLTRSCGIDAVWPSGSGSPNNQPAHVLFDTNGDIPYVHEVEFSTVAGAFLESGAFALGDGDQTMLIQKVLADGANGAETLTLYTGNIDANPGFIETIVTPLTVGFGSIVDTRVKGRFVRFKHTLSNSSSRIGEITLGIIPSGKR
jgi:hypothetical protein